MPDDPANSEQSVKAPSYVASVLLKPAPRRRPRLLPVCGLCHRRHDFSCRCRED